MKPYYDEDGITIYHGDCLQVMPIACDLVVTDPPFNAGIDYGESVNDRLPTDEYVSFLGTAIDLMESCCSGPIFMFLSVNGLLDLSAVRRPRHVCVWDKPLSLSPRTGGTPFIPHWEPCVVYGKTWGDGGRVPKWFLADVMHHNPSKRNGHPCPKPLGLIKQIIGASDAQTVLDPFMGSGTTLRAAKDLGRKAIGIEIEEKYCEIAAKRLAQRVLL